MKGKTSDRKKLCIKEAIIVEGRDDTQAVKRAVEGLIIETHGFGIKRETWELIEKAYRERGIIVFTDPDHAGEEIRRKITSRFPEAKQAFLSRFFATKKGDIGIENAEPNEIRQALEKVCSTVNDKMNQYTIEDLFNAGLSGVAEAKSRREQLGQVLGIGYGNAKGLLNKLNEFGIEKEDFYEALRTIDNQRN